MRTASNAHTYLDKGLWRRRKGAYVRLLLSSLGIAVPRLTSTSMLSNTGCTSLLLQGAAVSADASPP
jgi:hypothetical protein